MILGRYLLTALGLNLKFSENLIVGGEGPCEGCLSPMDDLSNYDFEYLTEKCLNRNNPLLFCTSTNDLNPRAQ